MVIFYTILAFMFLWGNGMCNTNPTESDLFAKLNLQMTIFYEITNGENPAEGNNRKLTLKWLQNDGSAILCNENFQKIHENLRIKKTNGDEAFIEKAENNWNNFCAMFKNGKSIRKIETNLVERAKESVLNLETMPPALVKNIRKIAQNENFNAENKQKMAELLDQFIVGLNIFRKLVGDTFWTDKIVKHQQQLQLARRKRRANLIKSAECLFSIGLGALAATLGIVLGADLGQKRHNDVESYFELNERLEVAGIFLCFFLFVFCIVYICKTCRS